MNERAPDPDESARDPALPLEGAGAFAQMGIIEPSLIFEDGFESGGLTSWLL